MFPNFKKKTIGQMYVRNMVILELVRNYTLLLGTVSGKGSITDTCIKGQTINVKGPLGALTLVYSWSSFSPFDIHFLRVAFPSD